MNIQGTEDNDPLIGTAGDDTLVGGFGDDTLTGDAGADVFVFNSAFRDEIGNDFDDNIITDFGVEQGDRIDVRNLGITSFESIDEISFLSNSNDLVLTFFEDGDRSTFTLEGIRLEQLSASNFIFSENTEASLIEGQDEEDYLFAGGGNDTLNGLADNDILFGEADNDILIGGFGSDTLVGDVGADIFVFNSSFRDELGNDFDDDVVADFSVEQEDRINVSSLGITNFNSIEEISSLDNQNNLVLTFFEDGDRNTFTLEGIRLEELSASSFVFSDNTEGTAIEGQDEEDYLFAGGGNDTVEGLNGNDILFGEADNDILIGGFGSDTLVGDVGADIFVFNSSFRDELGNDFDDDVVADFSIEQEDRINVSSLGITNLDSINEISSLDNNNNLVLTFLEDGDRNTLTVEGIRLNELQASDFIFSEDTEGTAIGGQDEQDYLFAGGGDDTVEGLSGNDILFGEAGNDSLIGGIGNDTIFGGEGEDVAEFDGNRSEYEITTNSEGNTEVRNISELNEGTDILIDMEAIQFRDLQVPIADPGIPVYRFFRSDTQTQFYTTSEVERDSILTNLPQYQLEGVSFFGLPQPEEVGGGNTVGGGASGEGDNLTGIRPIYRFFNTNTGIHLYTADENERAFVQDNLSNFTFEGTPYYGYEIQQEGTVPLYRFYNASLDAHFYTPNAEERNFFIQSPNYQPEGGGDGIAFYVNPANDI